MDVHRCRFVNYQPSAINALAFSHPKPKSSKHAASAKLAVGRANGDIEIWNPLNGTWHQELVIRGGRDRSIDGLVWVNEPDQDLGDGRVVIGKSRLFSIGYTSTVTEWDLEKGKPKRHASGQHGDIWCIAAQPSAPGQESQKLVAGTINGELVIYSVEDGDLNFQRVLVKSTTKKSQMVSITFQSRKVAIVGCSDGTVRAYDMSGKLLRRMTVGADLVNGSKDVIIWCVKCLPNGDIVSGDSTGEVCIWDGKTYTQLQRMSSHKQDVLSLATSIDGTSILSGGMDRRTYLHKKDDQWAKAWGRRYHDHDVKAMASFEYGRTSVVVAGGPDSNLVIIPLREMGREKHRTISNLPQQPAIVSASKSRFIISWWEREVHIWALPHNAEEIRDKSPNTPTLNQNRKLLKTIVVKGDSNISSATVNEDGTLLIVSTATDIKAFRLEHQDPVKPSDLKLSSLDLPAKLTSSGASHVRLSPDSKWLCIVQEGTRVLVAKLDWTAVENEDPKISLHAQKLTRLRRNIPKWVAQGGLGGYDRNITHVAFAADSAMLATADLAGYIDTWVLEDTAQPSQSSGEDEAEDDASEDSSDEDEDEAAVEGRWARNSNGKLLPKLPSAPAVLSFSNSSDVLLAITCNWNLLAFDPRKGSLTRWSRQHPRKALPAPIQDLLDHAKGVLWQGERVWVYGVSYLLMLDMSQNIAEPTDENGSSAVQLASGTKRKRKGPTSGAGGDMGGEAPFARNYRKYVNGEWEDVQMEEAPGREDDSDVESENGAELSQLRNGDETGDMSASGERMSWWITHKYRPIFGVVPLNTTEKSIEVALVERPIWDVEMAETYYDSDKWRGR
ncbi:WD40-repeat-containing domain protein [Stachybotrys elegans]|uniref:WD40-repeat-containing domain protein n=1 Tax=Stachybotrys elegans TaxID=80388 RepID=A0A8K0ST41_9HYPO|nr:WD40-repeat-containing domain protein [Stachybotrys elegans]